MSTNLGMATSNSIQWSATAFLELSADPGSIPANSSKQVTITLPPVTPPVSQVWTFVLGIAPMNSTPLNQFGAAWGLPASIGVQAVSLSAGTVTITLINNSASPVDPGTVRFLLILLGGN